MAEVLKISKTGNDAVTETDPNDLIYSSDYNTLKYHISGTIDVTPSGATAEGTVAHNLGYKPFFTAFVNKYATPGGADFNMCPGTFRNTLGSTTTYIYANAYADDDNVYLRLDTNFSTTTYTFRYFIFRNNTSL